MQTQVFTLVSSIVERIGDYVTPHATTILAWLPEVWHNSAGQGLLRMQVLPSLPLKRLSILKVSTLTAPCLLNTCPPLKSCVF